MTTFLLSIILTQFALEAAVSYLLYKKRHLVKSALQKFLGFDGLHDAIYDNFKYAGGQLDQLKSQLGTLTAAHADSAKVVRHIRRAQKKAAKPKVNKLAPVLENLNKGLLISAIKEYRNIFGCSLLDAKNACEALRDNRPVPARVHADGQPHTA